MMKQRTRETQSVIYSAVVTGSHITCSVCSIAHSVTCSLAAESDFVFISLHRNPCSNTSFIHLNSASKSVLQVRTITKVLLCWLYYFITNFKILMVGCAFTSMAATNSFWNLIVLSVDDFTVFMIGFPFRKKLLT